LKKKININLISHASGELVEMLARNAVTQLEGVEVKRRLWKMVRRLDQVPQILTELETSPGFVIHSISHDDVREALEEGCRQLHIPFQFALEPLIGRLAKFSDAPVKYYTSSGDAFDEDYYRRIEAMKYTLAHDDGIGGNDLETADVVVVGVSRSTKTPTCMYLASRGVKAANVPLVPGAPPPASLLRLKGPLVVGLTINPARLALIRTRRGKYHLCRPGSAAQGNHRGEASFHSLRLADHRRQQPLDRADGGDDHRSVAQVRERQRSGRAGFRLAVYSLRLFDASKKIPSRCGSGLKVPSLRWVREGQTLSAGALKQ